MSKPFRESDHKLVITLGDEELHGECSCLGEEFGYIRPDQSLDVFAAKWERHVMGEIREGRRVTTQPTTQPRPWAAVAPLPLDLEPRATRAHFAAMFIAHDKALDALGPVIGNEDVREVEHRHVEAGRAAFTAAALAILGDHTFTLQQVSAALSTGSARMTAEQWLTGAGIAPASIEAAS